MNTPWWLTPCKPVNHEISMAAAARQQQLTKPAGSLGQLEALAVQLAGLQGRLKPRVDQLWIAIFAGDHGVVAEGVSAYPQAVTGQMLHNFVSGGAAISVLARQLGAQLDDLGVFIFGRHCRQVQFVVHAQRPFPSCGGHGSHTRTHTVEQRCKKGAGFGWQIQPSIVALRLSRPAFGRKEQTRTASKHQAVVHPHGAIAHGTPQRE